MYKFSLLLLFVDVANEVIKEAAEAKHLHQMSWPAIALNLMEIGIAGFSWLIVALLVGLGFSDLWAVIALCIGALHVYTRLFHTKAWNTFIIECNELADEHDAKHKKTKRSQ